MLKKPLMREESGYFKRDYLPDGRRGGTERVVRLKGRSGYCPKIEEIQKPEK